MAAHRLNPEAAALTLAGVKSCFETSGKGAYHSKGKCVGSPVRWVAGRKAINGTGSGNFRSW